MHGRLAKDDMPRILKDAPADVVRQRRRQQPGAVALVVAARARKDRRGRNGESGRT